jgi:membrane associated rhomboid family serine protease
VGFLILLVVLVAFVYRITSPEERAKYLDIARDVIAQLRAAAARPRPAADAFRAALRARTPRLFITPAIAAINVILFACLLFGAGAIGDPDTLVSWGASVGPRTTNGEWWRLLTSTFVHIGVLHLLVSIAILMQLGAILERLAGRMTFAAAYLSAGVCAGLIDLSSHPVAVSVGASGAIFGLYGLLLASLIYQLVFNRRRPAPAPDPELPSELHVEADAEQSAEPDVRIPLIEMKRLAIGATLFIVYAALSGLASAADLTGLVVGLGYGLVLVRRNAEQPTMRRVLVVVGVASVIAVAFAIPLRHIADVKPELARVIAAEEHTAATYQAALDAFKKGRTTADALAQLAERTIIPELQGVDTRLAALNNVPPEHQPIVADAHEFLRLRYESWRLRAAAIRRTNTGSRRASGDPQDASWRVQAEARFRSNMAANGTAEAAERASMAAFQRLRATLAPRTP